MEPVFLADVEQELEPEADSQAGFTRLNGFAKASPSPVFRNWATASAKAPTPGKITFEARRIRSGSEVISAECPTVSIAFWTLRRLPIP